METNILTTQINSLALRNQPLDGASKMISREQADGSNSGLDPEIIGEI